MKSTQRNLRANRTLDERELHKRLRATILAIIIILGIFITSLGLFGPTIGSLFGLISVHRNEADDDKFPPLPPVFSDAPDATKDKAIILNGLAEPSSTVKLFVNGPEKNSGIADSEGIFTFADIELIEGNNNIFAKAIDEIGNESENSQTIQIILDTKKPEIKIDAPKNGETIKNLDKRVQVSGSINEKATVKVNGRFAVVKPDLTFEILLGVEEGNIEIKVEATDKAENKNEEKIFITYVKESP